MSNEKGFIYPISLWFLLFFSISLIIAMEENLMEKQFFQETEKILVGEYYLLAASKKVETVILQEDVESVGMFNYSNGNVSYEISTLSENLSMITFQLTLDTGERWQATAYYDYEQQKMVKWMELN